jgi:hypothetical protein
VGPEKPSIRQAQQAACLEACKQLHENGAFTDMLLPERGTLGDAGGPVIEEAASEGPIKRRAYREKPATVLGGKWIQEKRRKGEKTIMQLYAVEIVKTRKLRKGTDTEVGEKAGNDMEVDEKELHQEGGAVTGSGEGEGSGVESQMQAQAEDRNGMEIEEAQTGGHAGEIDTVEGGSEGEAEGGDVERDEGGEGQEIVTSFGFLLEQRVEEELLSVETELFVKKDVVTSKRLLHCGEVHLAQSDVSL